MRASAAIARPAFSDLGRESVEAAVVELHALSWCEYLKPLHRLLESARGDLRLQRLTGILLKRPFAKAVSLDDPTPGIGGRYEWRWCPERLDHPALRGTGEYLTLIALRDTVPQRFRGRPGHPRWEDLIFEADHQRGLYKLLSRWARQELTERSNSDFRCLFSPDRGSAFESRMAIVDALCGSPALGRIAAVVPAPAVAVALALIGLRFGYLRLTAGDDRPDCIRGL